MISLGFNGLVLKVEYFGVKTFEFLQILENWANSEAILAGDLESILNGTRDRDSKNGVLVISVDLLGPIVSFQDRIVLDWLEGAEVELLEDAKRCGFDDLLLGAGALEAKQQEDLLVFVQRLVLFNDENLVFLGLIELLVWIYWHLNDFVIRKLSRIVVNLDVLETGKEIVVQKPITAVYSVLRSLQVLNARKVLQRLHYKRLVYCLDSWRDHRTVVVSDFWHVIVRWSWQLVQQTDLRDFDLLLRKLAI